MIVLIDTNIMLDYILDRDEFSNLATQVLSICNHDDITAYITANTIADMYYVVKKELGDKKARDIIESFAILYCTDLKRIDVINSFSSYMNDFEDAMLDECAARLNADFIITRDLSDFDKSSTKAISPKEFLAMF